MSHFPATPRILRAGVELVTGIEGVEFLVYWFVCGGGAKEAGCGGGRGGLVMGGGRKGK